MVVLEWLVAFWSENCIFLGLVSLPCYEEISNLSSLLFLTTAVNWSTRHNFVSLAVSSVKYSICKE